MEAQRCVAELLRVADDMDSTRRRHRQETPYITLLGLVVELERRAWNCVLHSADGGFLGKVPGLDDLIAFDSETGPRPPFVPEKPWSWDGGALQPFRILCGQGWEYYERGPIAPSDANPKTMENGEQMEPLKCGPLVPSSVLLPSLFPRDLKPCSAHALALRPRTQVSYRQPPGIDAERIEYLRSRCQLGATACRHVADLVLSEGEGSSATTTPSEGEEKIDLVELETLLAAECLTRTESGAVTRAPGLYWDEIQPIQASLRSIEKTLQVTLEAIDAQWYGKPEYEVQRANCVAWAWNRYHLAYAGAIKIGRHVPGSPPLPTERFPREGVGIATDISAAMIVLRDWLEDLIPRARSNRAIARGKPSVAKPYTYTHDQLSSDTQVRLEQLCLQAIERLEAVGKERRQNAIAISGEITASGTHTSETQVKAPLARLVKVGAIKSCVGRGGGYWLEDRDSSVPA